MRLVVDANIFIAAFLKNAVTRELLLDEQLEFATPEYGLIETHKILKQPKVLKRLGLSPEDFEWAWSILISAVKVIPEAEYHSSISEAIKLISDTKDVPYLACALKLELPIWTNDPDFQIPRVRSRVPILTTDELIKRLKR